ncbi:MAG: TetR family transcriptional regulator [Candidatus Eiseniibacteriota bacterium]
MRLQRRGPTARKPATKGAVRKRDADATRAKILDAALVEFAEHGLPDTRTEDVALRAGVNRRMIYYYFGSKEGLYLAALEAVYLELIEVESRIDVEHMDPVAAIAAMVDLKIDHYRNYPRFVAFLNMENLYGARYLRKSKRLGEFMTPLTQIIGRVLERGQRQGIFRKGIDPVELYISICALGYLYFANRHTLGAIFGRDLMSAEAIARRKKTNVDIIISYLQRGIK